VLLANWAAAQGAWCSCRACWSCPTACRSSRRLTLRDAIHRAAGGAASAAVWLGIAASLAQAASDLLGGGSLAEAGGVARIALAGVLAFARSARTLDKRWSTSCCGADSWVGRALKSNAVSTLLDSLVFIGLAFGLLPGLILGQWLSKMLIAALVIAVLKGPAEECL
jgi:uncharacterized PurR-regulated membrane protein YhhQ (DUF165 family)